MTENGERLLYLPSTINALLGLSCQEEYARIVIKHRSPPYTYQEVYK